MKAEDLFLKKYGNKITASESWVIRFAEEYAKIVAEKAFEAGGCVSFHSRYNDFTQWLNQYLKLK